MKKEWQTKKLGEVCSFDKVQGLHRGLPYVGLEHIESHTGRFIGSTDPEAVQSSTFRFSSVHVLYGRLRPYLNKALAPDFNGHCSTEIFPLKPGQELSRAYLLFWLLADETCERINATCTGARMPRAQMNAVLDFDIALPPLAEQARIVGLLEGAVECLSTATANTGENLRSAQALFENLLNSAIQGELVPQDSRDGSAAGLILQVEKARQVAVDQGRAKGEKSEPLDKRKGRGIKLPRTWQWAQLESLTVGISDGVHKKPHYVSTGIPFVTVKNLTEGPGISFRELNYVSEKDHEEFIKRTHPEKGDILITKDGTIGVVRLIDTDIEFSIFVSVALIKPVMRELAPYLAYALRASCVQSQIVPQGAALKHLYLVDLRRLVIPLPPLGEQRRIVSALNTLEERVQRLVRIYEQKLAALEALKKSLLHEAFSGNL